MALSASLQYFYLVVSIFHFWSQKSKMNMNYKEDLLIELRANCPFTVMLLYQHSSLSANRLYTVTSVFAESDQILAQFLELSFPLPYVEEKFQRINAYNPN